MKTDDHLPVVSTSRPQIETTNREVMLPSVNRTCQLCFIYVFFYVTYNIYIDNIDVFCSACP